MKNILITGATSGIGYETAFCLSKMGYAVFLTGRNEEVLRRMSRELAGSLGFYALDLSETASIGQLFDEIRQKGIKLDGMVCCAGIDSRVSPVRSVKQSALEQLMKIHYFAFVELCRLFYKRDISNDGASIVALSSLAAWTCQKNSLDYSCSKAAVNAAIRVISGEYLRRGIRVNGILPANVDTPMCKRLKETVDIETIQPMGYIEPEQVAYLIEFLLSEKARYITGALIPVSAGMEY